MELLLILPDRTTMGEEVLLIHINLFREKDSLLIAREVIRAITMIEYHLEQGTKDYKKKLINYMKSIKDLEI